MELYVSAYGNDFNNGQQETPIRTIERAHDFVRLFLNESKETVRVIIQEGTYYLKTPLQFTAQDSGSKDTPVIYEGIGNVIISGGIRLNLQWEPYRDGIYQAKVNPGVMFDQLFVNGKKKILARYPDYDDNEWYFNGYAADSFEEQRVKDYKKPEGGYMHVMHEGLWGDFHYQITGKGEDGQLEYFGGHQNNRPSEMHDTIRYIENIQEELTSPGEWYFDKDKQMLFYKPELVEELETGIFEGAVLRNIVSFVGSVEEPVQYITMKNLKFAHAARTFMEPMEQVLRSDWCVYRGGAVFLEGTEHVVIEQCKVEQTGGNAVTFSGYNYGSSLRQSLISEAEASSVVILGKSEAVRSPLYRYEESFDNINNIDMGQGPKTQDYPRQCRIEDNLMFLNGRTEKQSAAVCLSMCREIHITNNTIYDVPRAGINICDGTWGGHHIEKNLVFHTVLETSDHGAFNSWGRDRYWDCRYEVMEQQLKDRPDFPLLDVIEPTVIRNNLFECAHGWDIDLDDGSSNYIIEGNLCLRGGIKNREGILRKVRNNIILNNTFHPHVWFYKSGDSFEKNIIFKPYADIGLREWGEGFDHNVLYREGEKCSADILQKKSGQDKNSICVQVEFADLKMGKVQITNLEKIAETGFENIDTSDWGVQNQVLKALAKSPFSDSYQIETLKESDILLYEFDGMHMKKLSGIGELSATGMYMESGIFIKEIKEDSPWYRRGVRAKDVLLNIDGQDLMDVHEAMEVLKNDIKQMVIWREQGKRMI